MEEQEKTELVTRENIPNSPLWIVGYEDKYYGLLGNYRLTEPMDTKEEVRELIEPMTWDNITRLIQIVIELNKQ